MKVFRITLFLLATVSLSLLARAASVAPQESSSSASAATTSELLRPALKITNAKFRADGSFEFQVDSPESFKVAIQTSPDLVRWDGGGPLYPPNTPLVFSIPAEPKTNRFYRAVDYTQRITGTVRDILTDLPLSQATVTLADSSSATPDIALQTDEQGVFRTVVSQENPVRRFTVEKTGYELLTTYFSSSDLQVPLWLTPPGYRPPNDDFQNRLPIEGTNVTVRARTFAATSEPGHSLDFFFFDVVLRFDRNLWWTWTAPKDGAVLFRTESTQVSGGSAMIVYTGESLPELVTVWDSAIPWEPWSDWLAPQNGFFVQQGVEYHIVFGTRWPAETAFTLRMISPEPSAVDVRDGDMPLLLVGERLALGSDVMGPRPLTYQWRKDGVDILNATNASFGKTSAQLEDTGAYSLLVANQGGSKLSDEIYITVLEQIPAPLELIQGTWSMDKTEGPLLITFAGNEFTVKRAADNTARGSGHFTISSWRRDRLRLEMTYTGSPENLYYINILLTRPDTGTYVETDSKGLTYPDHQRGPFTRLPLP